MNSLEMFGFTRSRRNRNFFDPTKALMVDDLPTFGYPTNPICNFLSGNSGSTSNLGAESMNNFSNSSILIS